MSSEQSTHAAAPAVNTPPVQFRVLDGPRKGWSWLDADGQQHEGAEYPDMRDVRDADPRNVRRTFDFTTEPADVLPTHAGPWAKQLSAHLAQLREAGADMSTATFVYDDGRVMFVA